METWVPLKGSMGDNNHKNGKSNGKERLTLNGNWDSIGDCREYNSRTDPRTLCHFSGMRLGRPHRFSPPLRSNRKTQFSEF